jgi:hypothetical protein
MISDLMEIEIRECVHYCAFRYGHDEYHPYETFVKRLHRGDAFLSIRDELELFLKKYRPRHLGEALGAKLDNDYPLWLFPWSRWWKFFLASRNSGWYATPERIPDILTHFSRAGIPKPMIEKELRWLQGAYRSITEHGYRPEVFGFPKGRLLQGVGGRRACLVLDGNHRVSALSAHGYGSLLVHCARWNRIALDDLESWPGVKLGFFPGDDAERIFAAYFSGNHKYSIGVGDVPLVG